MQHGLDYHDVSRQRPEVEKHLRGSPRVEDQLF
jgi:hypothetical protein